MNKKKSYLLALSIAWMLSLTMLSHKAFGQAIFKDPKTQKEYLIATDFVFGFANIYAEGKYGVISRDKKVMVPCVYDEIIPFYGCDPHDSDNILPSSVAIVKRKGKYGLIDTLGNVIIPIIYRRLVPLSCSKQKQNCSPVRMEDTHYIAELKNKLGLITKKNLLVLAFAYDGISISEKNYLRLYRAKRNKKNFDYIIRSGWATMDGEILSLPIDTTILCHYPENKIQLWPVHIGCENKEKGHTCDPIPLPCYQSKKQDLSEEDVRMLRKKNKIRRSANQ